MSDGALTSVSVNFYHLTHTPLTEALPRLLAQALARGHRLALKAADAAQASALDQGLWTWDPDSFLPHGLAHDSDAEEQPILIGLDGERSNNADVLVLLSGSETEELAGWSRCLYLFDGDDEEARAAARSYWRTLRDRNVPLVYWRQGENGWEQGGGG